MRIFPLGLIAILINISPSVVAEKSSTCEAETCWVTDVTTEADRTAIENHVNELSLQAGLLHRSANLEEAQALFEQALEDDPEHINSLVGLANVYIDLGRNPLAVDKLAVAVAAVKKGQPGIEAAQRLAIGKSLAGANALLQAREQFELAVTRAQDAGNIKLGVRIYIAYADSYSQSRRFEDAATYFAAANRLLEKLDEEETALDLEQELLLTVAIDEIRQGNLSNSADLLLSVMDDNKAGLLSLEIAEVSRELGNAFVDRDDIDTAELFLELAAGLFRELLGPAHPTFLEVWLDLQALGSPT